MDSVPMIKKKSRGYFDYRCDGDVYVCRWNDNSIVTIEKKNIASNHQTYIPVEEALRRVKGVSRVKVKQPYLIKQYNQGMGGVDFIDRMLSA